MATGAQYIGQYRLLGLIRTGATCQVWEAYDAGLARRVALKVLMAEYRNNRAVAAELRQEFEVAKALDHRRVIRQFELQTTGQDVFLVMELFAAPNMKQLLQMPADKGMASMLALHPKIILQCAEGLAYLHEQRWLHRDIKPHNYLIDKEGDVKLIDFSLAARPAGFLGRLFKRGGRIQGTRTYMPPEQIRGLALDYSADVYSFGCTIYEMVAGKPAFTGTSANDLLNRHLRSPPPVLAAAVPSVTPEFSELIRKCLAKLPKQRYQSMQEVLSELQELKIYKVPASTGKRG